MCGITGFFTTGVAPEEGKAALSQMVSSISHRGPDDSGTWSSPIERIYFGHLRLAILDLSPEGHQPMHSRSGRFTIVFNGEIYNFQELKGELEARGHKFRGGSDTEVMLAAFEEYGLKESVKRFNGMFAFAVWDHKEGVLSLVRDRFAVKPLYYSWTPQGVAFGSELKPFHLVPGLELEVDRTSLGLMLQYAYVPSPYSIFKNVFKLPGGTILSIPTRNFDSVFNKFSFDPESSSLVRPERYWSARDVVRSSRANAFRGSEEEAVNELDALLRDSIKLRMIADVPLGAFLSGGIDSSTVVALMQAQSTRPVKTFSIGFNDAEYNELTHARNVATHLHTDHTELIVSPSDALAVIPKLPAMYDEPFGDSSQIPTYLVSKLARERVTVSLSGDGGDEFFSGYNRYQWGESLWSRLSSMPEFARGPVAGLLTSVSPTTWNKGLSPLKPVMPHSLRTRNLGEKMHRLASLLKLSKRQGVYSYLISFWDEIGDLVPGSSSVLTDHHLEDDSLSFSELMMMIEAVTYLSDDILVKVDRATMAVALEGREPLLDYRLFEFAWRLPQSMKVKNGKGKWPLRQVLYRYVPKEMVERPKMGFAVPLGSWIKQDLRDWAEALLDERRLREQGNLAAPLIRKRWDEHLAGKQDWSASLWNVLMFQAWYEGTFSSGMRA